MDRRFFFQTAAAAMLVAVEDSGQAASPRAVSLDPLQGKAVQLFRDRLGQLAGISSRAVPLPGEAAHALQVGEGETAFTVLVGSVAGSPRLRKVVESFSIAWPTQPESFLLHAGQGDPPGDSLWPSNRPWAVVAGADAHGVLYGLGRLLRKLEFRGPGLSLPPCHEIQAPAIRDRGVYCATHFNNFYECAPLDKITHYIEEMALWGFNLLSFWFDMNWFPYGFWDDPDSRGMQMIRRLCTVAETARSCGMRVGTVGVANEGFRGQPPPELRADISGRRGGFYPDSQICPSQPGGWKMILDNRRQVLELLGPLDFYVHWPYDQGGCGCALCSDAEHRWGRTFLQLGPPIAQLVKQKNPYATFLVSTWLCDEEERRMVYDRCDQGADWFDGVMQETQHATERLLPPRYARFVFPEISMFDCFYTSYGCNGANPAPRRFVQEARRTVKAGAGVLLYSEGMYEDLNKVVWANVLWDPAREAQAIVEEYSRYYFGFPNQAPATDLILKLETTWGPARLAQTSPVQAQELWQAARSLQEHLPEPWWCRDRWQALHDRTEMDYWMVQIGPERELLRAARRLFEEASCTDDWIGLKGKMQAFCAQLRQRQDLMDQLFALHWRYLKHFHIEKTTLLFLPDALVGSHNFQPLLERLERALTEENPEAGREEILKAFKRWLWGNGLDLEFLFL